MKIVIEEQGPTNGWESIAVVKAADNKQHCGYNLPMSIQGELAGVAAKSAINYFRAENAAVQMDFDYNGHKFRVSKVQ